MHSSPTYEILNTLIVCRVLSEGTISKAQPLTKRASCKWPKINTYMISG